MKSKAPGGYPMASTTMYTKPSPQTTINDAQTHRNTGPAPPDAFPNQWCRSPISMFASLSPG
jgi:hypothetical protein